VHGGFLGGGAAAIRADVVGQQPVLPAHLVAAVRGDQPPGPGIGAVVEQEAVDVLVGRVRIALALVLVLALVVALVLVGPR
jgi:hypothetical protein